MGRRSINTTKSGKYMNPTDQARKEARKKELKKNKKQRQLVRAAVLKGKDPAQLLDEMEKIDEMEYNVLQPSPLNEKVLREKRKKLKETFDRVMRLYHTDDPELWSELKRKEIDYEKRRNKRVQYYESVKHAQTVQIEDIPLPQMNEQAPSTTAPAVSSILPLRPPPLGPNIELPSGMMPPILVPGIPPPSLQRHLSDRLALVANEKRADNEPGCPPGPPPDLCNMRELDSDYEDEENIRPVSRSTAPVHTKPHRSVMDDDDDGNLRKPTSVQQRILALAGQKYDDFMKELENVHKNKEKGKVSGKHDVERPKTRTTTSDNDGKDDESGDASDDSSRGSRSDSSRDKHSDASDVNDEPSTARREEAPRAVVPEHRPISLPRPPPAPPMPPMMKLPSGPPPPPMGMPPAMMFRPPPMPGMRMAPGMPPRIRMPPGPPPGMPPSRMMPPHRPNAGHNTMATGPPSTKDSTKGMTTITAKPQIRNLSADVTRFVPSTLRVKREDKKVQRPKPYVSDYRVEPEQAGKGTTKDDAYMQFMREMQGLL